MNNTDILEEKEDYDPFDVCARIRLTGKDLARFEDRIKNPPAPTAYMIKCIEEVRKQVYIDDKGVCWIL